MGIKCIDEYLYEKGQIKLNMLNSFLNILINASIEERPPVPFVPNPIPIK